MAAGRASVPGSAAAPGEAAEQEAAEQVVVAQEAKQWVRAELKRRVDEQLAARRSASTAPPSSATPSPAAGDEPLPSYSAQHASSTARYASRPRANGRGEANAAPRCAARGAEDETPAAADAYGEAGASEADSSDGSASGHGAVAAAAAGAAAGSAARRRDDVQCESYETVLGMLKEADEARWAEHRRVEASSFPEAEVRWCARPLFTAPLAALDRSSSWRWGRLPRRRPWRCRTRRWRRSC